MTATHRSIALCLGFAALTLHAAAQERGEDALKAQRDAFVSAFNAQDAARLAALYGADAIFLPFTGQTVKGAAAIAPGMARVASQLKIDLQPVSSAVSGTLAYESGTWTHADRASGAVVDGGAYVWVWRQDERGVWTIASHAVTRKPAAPK